ncbi:MAG: nucleotidyl transferase AbiEii/AbiGii toxin family protein [Planctomycetes bacterium]|nr:nucleotidyl transferase AbiEii/AbiGii toxin family protein [Planctomycetota bacterium]
MSTDLDFSCIGLELERPTDADHIAFATDIGTRATAILRGAYQDAADVAVRFVGAPEPHEDGENPDTAVYRIQVEAQLRGKHIEAKSRFYKIDVTTDEDVDESQVEDLIVTTFGINIDVRAYTAVQSISEKLRALLQKRRHFERNQNAGNWVPRHLFDLVPLRRLAKKDHLALLPELFRRKCAARQLAVDPMTRAWLLDPRLLAKAREQHARLADRAWQVLEEFVELLGLP